MDMALDVISDCSSEEWRFVTAKREVSIFSRITPSSNGMHEVKSVTTVSAGVDDILRHLTNPNRRRSKKDSVFESKVIETDPSNDTTTLYRAQKMPWPLKVGPPPSSPPVHPAPSPHPPPPQVRDFVLVSKVIRLKSGPRAGGAVWAVWSTVHPDYPPTEERVRAQCKCLSWILEPVTDWKTNVTYLLQVDLQGSLPTKIKNKIMTQDAMCAADLSR
jgi:hypothetical protein